MGAILRNYRPKPSHMDPVRSNFHDFPPNLAFSNLHSLHICFLESIYLLYENQIVSSAEKLELLLQGVVVAKTGKQTRIRRTWALFEDPGLSRPDLGRPGQAWPGLA